MDETFENAERIGYPKYEISRSGKVRNAITKKLYKPQMHRRGYLWLPMQRPEGGWFCEYIHQLVARMYIPNPHRKPQVNHIDGDKQNNVVENLEWVTNVENARHAMKHGLMPHAIINEEKVHEICQLFEKGKLPTEVSKITKVPRTTVYAIWYRRNWVDISSKYDFKQSYHQNKRMTEETMHTVCKCCVRDYHALKYLHIRECLLRQFKRYHLERIVDIYQNNILISERSLVLNN